MALINFIKEYQTLIGSFLGVIFSVAFLYYKLYIEKKREIENNKEEIKQIFFMATRESEDAIKDLEMYTATVSHNLKTTKGGLKLFIPPKFNRIYINEERLFSLSKNLGFIISQQINIATSSAKKFNNDLDQLEGYPKFAYESTIRIIQSGLFAKEKAIEDYIHDMKQYVKEIRSLLDDDLKVFQRHLFRPLVAIAYRDKDLKKIWPQDIDQVFNKEADLFVACLKQDLS